MAKRCEKRKEAKLLKKQQDDADYDVPSCVDVNEPYVREEFESKDFQKVLRFLHLAFTILMLCLRRSLKTTVEETANDPACLELLLINRQDGK